MDIILAAAVHMPGLGLWICFLGFCLVVGAIIALGKLLTRPRGGAMPMPPQGFPVHNAPAHYVVHGVDKATKADKTWRVIADSDANARVKAEMEGMVVTSVVFERYV